MKKTKFPLLLIRADTGRKIGAGHIMRCIALSQEWKKHNGRVIFISNSSNSKLNSRITSNGFQLINLETSHPDREDIASTLSIIKETGADTIVVDGYHFNEAYHNALKNQGVKRVIIDDYNHLPFYNTDILINQNLGAEKFKYATSPATIKLIGKDYIMLRDEFLENSHSGNNTPLKAEKILVTMGDSDPGNTTLKVIKSLNILKMKNLKIKIILGNGFSHRKTIEKELLYSTFTHEIITDAHCMPKLMKWADMAVSASGSTSWELCFMGIPGIYLVNADNQKKIASALHKYNAGINAGWHNTVSHKELAPVIEKLINSPKKRENLFQNGKALIDGMGRKRINSVIN